MTTATAPPDATSDKPVRQLGDRIFADFARGAGVLILIVLAGVAAFLVVQAIPAFTASTAELPEGQNLGAYIGPLIFGTLLSSVIALIIGAPLGVAVALFITHYAPRRLAQGPRLRRRPARRGALHRLRPVGREHARARHARPVDVAQPVPGLDPALRRAGVGHRPHDARGRRHAGRDDPPIITAVSREVFLQTPKLHEEAALALGATRWEMIRMAVLPFGRSGIISGAMLGLGRALGETMAVAIILSSSHVITLLVNAAARWIVNRRREFSGANGFSIGLWLVLSAVVYAVATYAISRGVEGRRKATDRLVTIVVTTAFLLALVPLISVIVVVVENGLSRFDTAFFTQSMRGVVGECGGGYHAVTGTLIITALASVISIPSIVAVFSRSRSSPCSPGRPCAWASWARWRSRC